MSLPPLDFLLQASLMSLQDAELAAANRESNIEKVIRHELQLWVEASATATLCRWFIENRDGLLRGDVVEQAGPMKADLFTVERKKSA